VPLSIRIVSRVVAVLCAVLAASGLAQAQAVVQTSGPNFGTWSVGQIETQLVATGGNGTYAWSLVGGTLPPGLSIRTDKPSFFPANASAGLIGVATTPGSFNFTLRVTSGAATADQACTLKVTALTAKDSFNLPDAFVSTQMEGTYVLLEAAPKGVDSGRH